MGSEYYSKTIECSLVVINLREAGIHVYLLLDGGRTMLESLLKDIYCVNDVFAGAPYSLNNFIKQVHCERIGIGSKI